jgi:hypothetical protein
LALAGALGCLWRAQAAPTILSTVPANGASGVSPTTTIVFTFSEAMDPDATTAFFYDNAVPIPNIYTTTDSREYRADLHTRFCLSAEHDDLLGGKRPEPGW